MKKSPPGRTIIWCILMVLIRKASLFFLVSLCAALSAFGQQKQKVFIDTDFAGDIDDAYAVGLVLASPEFDVVGITVGHGKTDKRARTLCKFLYELGLERIPVGVGRPTELIVGESQPANEDGQFLWSEGFETVKPVQTPAADLIIQTLRRNPNEITLITIGPVTNLGDVVKKDPEALKLAKNIYSMYGSFFLGYAEKPIPEAEWNVRADAGSAQLFSGAGATITYAGLDVTNIPLDEKRRVKLLMRQTPMTDALCALTSLWSGETPTLFDVVPVAMILWPDLFSIRPAHVSVTDDGFTLVSDGQAPNSRIGLSVNKDVLLQRLMERYLRQNLGRN